MTPILISLEGNIGSGKSTLLRALRAAHPEWHFVDEPVDQWLALKNAAGESLLELFYKDKRRWGYTFQNVALLTRVNNLKKVLSGLSGSAVVVMERSIGTDAYVFAKMLHEDGLIDDLEFKIYQMWESSALKDLPPVTGYIHLDTPVTICSERINQRAREGESAIPVEYLDKLDAAHFAWLRGDAQDVPVLRYDTYTPKGESTVKDVEDWIARVARLCPAQL